MLNLIQHPSGSGFVELRRTTYNNGTQEGARISTTTGKTLLNRRHTPAHLQRLRARPV